MFLASGFALFLNQAFYIIGLKLSNSTTASIWQPAVPIFAMIISLLLRMEAVSVLKVVGIGVAFFGAAMMIAFGGGSLSGNILANFLFIGNTTGTAMYVIITKPLLKTHVAIWVTGCSYMCASVIMFCLALIVNTNDDALNWVCPDCDGYAWNVPASAIGALFYWIILQSVLAYFLLTWGNTYADPSFTSAFAALQPFTAAILSIILIECGVTGLDSPGLNDLGALGIVAGLALVIWDAKRIRDQKLKGEKLFDRQPLINEQDGH